MGTICITGAASGIGAATTSRLTAGGHRVVSVDLRDADVNCDLTTPEGRAAMVDGVREVSGGALDGLVVGAGVANGPGQLVAAVNYYGAVATLTGLRPLLVDGSSVVAIASNSTTTAPALPGLADTLLHGSEPDGLDLAATDESGLSVYPATKLALARWVRRHAPTAEWIGGGVRLNAVAPGFIDTPMTEGGWDFVKTLGDGWPVPIDRPGRPDEIAALITFMLGDDAGFFVGSVVFCDGGTDAAMRADDWPSALS